MQSQDKEVQTLTRLGLTSCQARVYIALVRSGMSTAKTVSGVARESIYRIMPTLQKLGLVDKIITSPTKFKATLMQDAVSILLERRIKETCELQSETRELVKKYMENKAKTTLEEEEPQFVLVPQGKALAKKRRNATENAQTSIEAICSWKRYLPIIVADAGSIKKALKRGVKIRHITEKTKDEKLLPKIVQAIWKNPSYKVRYIPTPPKSVLTIYDKKEVLIVISPTSELYKSPALWSNNPSLVELAQNYFETMWTTAPEDKHEEH